MEKNKTRHICIFCESWESGGIESFLFNVLCSMNLDGMKIDIIVSQLKNSIFSEHLKSMGINFYELSGNQKRLIKNYRMLNRIFKENQYDVIHMNIFHAISYIYVLPARKNSIRKRIVHSHNTKIGRCRSYPLKKFLHWFFKSYFYGIFTDFWACSKDAAEFMFSKKLMLSGKFEIIPNGIDIERFAFNEKARKKTRAVLGIGQKPLLVNIGRLCEQKNQMFLLDVLKELTERGNDCTLLLVGEGEMLAALHDKAEKLEIVDKVIFYGTTSAVEDILSAGDVFLFPSIFEGFGIAALEAQTASLPVICSEYVPVEAFLTEQIRAVSLKEGAKAWSDAITDALTHSVRNISPVEIIQKKGFDIKETAGKIREKYAT